MRGGNRLTSHRRRRRRTGCGSRTPGVRSTVLATTVLAVGAVCSVVQGGPLELLEPSPADTYGVASYARSFTMVASGDLLVDEALAHQAAVDGHQAVDRSPEPAYPAGRGRADTAESTESTESTPESAAPVATPRYDFDQVLRQVSPVVRRADLALCHLAVPFGPAAGPFRYHPRYSVPPQLASTLATVGYDSCSTAANHALDGGHAGVADTLDALDAAGVRHSGTARTEEEARDFNLLAVAGARVAHLSYSHGLAESAMGERPWQANPLRAARILDDARRARAAGADVVVASLHWGQRARHTPDADQVELAHRLLTDPAVDLVLGHHTRLVQPFERIGDKWVAYGLGDLVAPVVGPDTPAAAYSMYARFTFTEHQPGRWRVTRAEYVPTVTERSPLRVVDPQESADRLPPRDPARERYLRALSEVAHVVHGRGGGRHGLQLAR